MASPLNQTTFTELSIILSKKDIEQMFQRGPGIMRVYGWQEGQVLGKDRLKGKEKMDGKQEETKNKKQRRRDKGLKNGKEQFVMPKTSFKGTERSNFTVRKLWHFVPASASQNDKDISKMCCYRCNRFGHWTLHCPTRR